jgi:hypothetical protein
MDLHTWTSHSCFSKWLRSEASRWLWNRSGTQELELAGSATGASRPVCLDVNGGAGPSVDLYSCHAPGEKDFANQQWSVAAGLLRSHGPKAAGSCLSLNFSVANISAPSYAGAGYCTAKPAVPEQINVQLASDDTVVVAFVTYGDQHDTGSTPYVMYRTGVGQMKKAAGVTHHYRLPSVAMGTAGSGGDDSDDESDFAGMDASLAHKEARTLAAIRARDGVYAGIGGPGPAAGREYQMHFVKLSGLRPRTNYSYTVSSGTPDAVTSDQYTFRAPYSEGTTKVAIFGDMGVSEAASSFKSVFALPRAWRAAII